MALTIGMVTNIKLKIHNFFAAVWLTNFHHYLENITKLIGEIFIKVSVDYHHKNLVENLIQCWTLIPEMCRELFKSSDFMFCQYSL